MARPVRKTDAPARKTKRSSTLESSDAAMFVRGLQAFSPSAQSLFALAEPQLRVRELARGEPLLNAGEPARQLAMVVSGWLREFYVLPDGSERTKAFAFEGDGSGSYADLMREGVATSFIVAEADARVVCLPFDIYRAMCAEHAGWAQLHTAVMEFLFLRKARREYELLALDAGARYQCLLDSAAGIELRVSGKHLASYLGITPVHLSRLRRARARGARPGA